MTIRQEISKNSQSIPWQEKVIETLKPAESHRDLATHVGYVSFAALRHTEWWNPDCNKILFFLDGIIEEIGFGVSLVPRMSAVNPVQTTKEATDCSEFWEEAHKNVKTFMIQYDSKESIKVLWRPAMSQTHAVNIYVQRLLQVCSSFSTFSFISAAIV